MTTLEADEICPYGTPEYKQQWMVRLDSPKLIKWHNIYRYVQRNCYTLTTKILKSL